MRVSQPPRTSRCRSDVAHLTVSWYSELPPLPEWLVLRHQEASDALEGFSDELYHIVSLLKHVIGLKHGYSFKKKYRGTWL